MALRFIALVAIRWCIDLGNAMCAWCYKELLSSIPLIPEGCYTPALGGPSPALCSILQRREGRCSCSFVVAVVAGETLGICQYYGLGV